MYGPPWSQGIVSKLSPGVVNPSRISSPTKWQSKLDGRAAQRLDVRRPARVKDQYWLSSPSRSHRRGKDSRSRNNLRRLILKKLKSHSKTIAEKKIILEKLRKVMNNIVSTTATAPTATTPSPAAAAVAAAAATTAAAASAAAPAAAAYEQDQGRNFHGKILFSGLYPNNVHRTRTLFSPNSAE